MSGIQTDSRPTDPERSNAVVLELDDLHVAYGKVEAVRGVSLRLAAAQIVTVLGANGAGKSTLLNAAMGILPCRGRIRLAGQPLDGLPIEERVRSGLSLVPEKRELFGRLSVEDNLALGAFRLERRRRTGLQRVYDLFPRLRERRRQQAGTLSGGERQMLAMGRALMAEPTILMLDEPSLGLAPRITAEILRTVLALKSAGVGILLVEQNARAALHVADTGYVMELGRFVLEGSADALAHDPRVIETYLGLRQAAPVAGHDDQKLKSTA